MGWRNQGVVTSPDPEPGAQLPAPTKETLGAPPPAMLGAPASSPAWQMGSIAGGGAGASSGHGSAHRIRWWIHLVLIGSFPVLVGVLGSSRPAVAAPALTHNPKGLVLICLLQLVIFGAIFGVAWLVSRAGKDDLLWRWRPGIWVVPLGIAYSIALRLVLGILAIFVLVALVLSHYVRLEDLQQFVRENRPDVSAIVDLSALRHNPLYFWLTLSLVSFVVAGFREELWRAAFLAGLRALWPAGFGSTPGQIGGVAIAAVVFGLGHLAQGPIAVILTGFLGLGLGTIMVLHRSIWPAVIAHGMFDATTFALLPLI